MGIVCCGGINNIEIEMNRRIVNPQFPQKKKFISFTNLVILVQSFYRRHRAILKLKKEINYLKEQIFSDLDKKKLINNTIITECASEKFYQNLILNGQIKSYMELINTKKKIKKDLRCLEKYSFFIPNYIVASPNEVYKGSWNLMKKYHGYGVKYEFNNKTDTDSRTEGTFNNGLLFGFGRIFLSNGEIFLGRFIKGKMMGNGEYIRKDGTKYEGQFFEGLPHGKGKEEMGDGALLEGEYFWGKPKKGKITWKDGSMYEGEFEDGKLNGFGVYDWGNKRKYIGNWKDGKMDGIGKLIYSDGTYYEGEFSEGKKNGQGKYVWEKNKYYVGQWKDDKPNGKGLYNKFGKETKGFWADGHLFSKNSLNNNNNTFKEVRKRPTLGAYSVSSNNKYNKLLNDSGDINIVKDNIKTRKSSTNIKNYNWNLEININNDNAIKVNKNKYNNNNNDDDHSSTNSIKIKQVSHHKYVKSNKI